jgi:hypothetical protein
VKLEFVIVVGSIARENVALTTVEAATPVALLTGAVAVTVGGDGAAVVKLQLTGFASGVPSEAVIAVDRFAVYVVENASAALGVSVAVFDVES